MEIKDFLSSADTFVDVLAPNKTQLLKELAERAASKLKLDASAVAGPLIKREALGSTGIGGGVAIPHARIPGLTSPFGMLARLSKPIDFDAIDGNPVNVIFLLLQPDSSDHEQLNALALVARKLRDPATIRDLHNAADSHAMHRIMVR